MDTGKIIRECRDVLKWPRTHLCEMADVSLNTVVTAEKRQDCKVSTFEKLLNAMGYEVKIVKRNLI